MSILLTFCWFLISEAEPIHVGIFLYRELSANLDRTVRFNCRFVREAFLQVQLGGMPDAIIHTWSNVWSYFEQYPKICRSFLTDFEAYRSPEQAHIYTGINTT